MRMLRLIFRQGLCQCRQFSSRGQILASQLNRPCQNGTIITPKFFRTMPVLHNTIIASFEEVKAVKNSPDTFLIDVREPSELQETGTIPGSINIPLGEVEAALRLSADEFEECYGRPKPTVSAPIIFSCKAGVRSNSAREVAVKLGFTNCKSFEGGWLEWEEKIKSK